MQKIRVGICIADTEYEKRFTNCLMNHYRTQVELHIFSGMDQLVAQERKDIDIGILANCCDELENLREQIKVPIVYLYDSEEESVSTSGKELEGGVHFVEKYQEVNRIMDEVLKRIGEEIKEVQENGFIKPKTRVAAVYSLSENEYQLPFAVTFASILSEKERVLVLDMQENSGLTQMVNCENAYGLEELLVMAEGGKYSYNRMSECIGHLERADFVYPLKNTESLCEISSGTYLKLIQMLCAEMDYDIIIVNLGARFLGFFEVLNNCHEIYFMQKKGGLCKWREHEFMQEMVQKGYTNLKDRMVRVETPQLSTPVNSCERLVEQWKWNEFGDLIRGMMPEVAAVG